MAIPSGSGTEVLQRGWFHGLSAADVFAKFDGTQSSTTNTNAVPAHTIITILNIVFQNQDSSNDELINMRVEYLGTDLCGLLSVQPLPASSTFVWSDKLILRPTDQLVFALDSTGNVDVHFNFIIQDWT